MDDRRAVMLTHVDEVLARPVAFLAMFAALGALPPSPAAAQACATTPAIDVLWAAVPSAERRGIEPPTGGSARPADAASRGDAPSVTALRLAMVDLDGTPGQEAVLAVDRLGGERYDVSAVSMVWVLRCRADRWSLIGHVELEIDAGWDGTIDDRPGVRTLRAEALAGVGHDFARIEQINVRGSYDPRFIARRLLLVHVVGEEVVVAFDAVVSEETESGPDRAPGPATIRSVVYRRGGRPAITFRVSEVFPSGRRRTSCSTVLTFDGRTFVPEDEACYER